MRVHVIDFDLADSEVSSNIPERHTDACSGSMRENSRDRYSLHYVLTRKSQLKLNDAVDILLDKRKDLNTIPSSILML